MLNDLLYAIDEKNNRYYFEVFKAKDSLLLTLKKEIIAEVKQLRVLPELSSAEAGDDGYYILPRTLRMCGEIQTYFKKRDDLTYSYDRPLMSWYGIKKKDNCFLIRVERNYWYKYEVTVKNNVYTACPLFDFTDRDPVYDDIRIELVEMPVDADYNAMARKEREIRLSRNEIVTLKEKCKNPPTEYARKYPLIRIRMGWKPSPSPVLIQTEVTEPDMFVACDFKRVRDIADELNKQNVEGAELQLVGWNRSGHDGRFPQLFPADERLGGDEELRKTIDYVKALGYRISTHTNTIDAYPIADTFTWEDIVVKRDGKYHQFGHYSGGLSYHVCLEKQLKNTKRDLPALAALGENGLHFTDVISIVPPDVCLSPDHPSSTSNSIIYAQKIIEYTRGLFGGFSSEGCMDFALKDLDYGLYVSFGDGFGKLDVPICDRYIPLWEVTYHGIALYNPLATTINFSIQPKKDMLTLLMRGGKPSMYFYSKFRNVKGGDWMGENDLTCETDEALKKSISSIKSAIELYSPFVEKQLVFIDAYEFLDNGLERVSYEDGTVIYGNFTDKSIVYKDISIGPWEYKIV